MIFRKNAIYQTVVWLALVGCPISCSTAQGQSTQSPSVVVNTGHSDSAKAIAFASSGLWVATMAGSSVKLWEVATGRLLRTLSGHSKNIESMAISPDGSRLVSCGEDGVNIWDTSTGALLHSIPPRVDPHGRGDTSQKMHPTGVAISHDGKTLFTLYFYGFVTRTDMQSGNESRIFEIRRGYGDAKKSRGDARPQGTAHSIALSPDGQWFVVGYLEESGSGQIALYDAANGQAVRTR
jgi:WD40 repeat protein